MMLGRLFLYCFVAFVIVVPAAVADKGVPQPLVEHMHEHYDAITDVRDAVIAGDLAAAREPARWLAEHDTPAVLPAAWYSHVEAMRASARAVYSATELGIAASATAAMAGACGSCHVANNVHDQFAEQDMPEDELGTLAHMARHQWSADRMWEGLIGPSSPAWTRGTELLLEVPLSSAELHVHDDDSKSIRKMARRVHQLAGNGLLEQSFSERVEIYSEFLATCAKCHVRLGRGPRR